jgi:hypothetical protein
MGTPFSRAKNPGCPTALARHLFDVFENSEEIGRVPHVRHGVRGPKKTGAAHNRFYRITNKSLGKPLNNLRRTHPSRL